MANPNEAKKFSPIADTGGIQDEFDVDKFVEAGLKEMTPEEVKEQKYKEWQNTGHDYLLVKTLSEQHAKNILRLDGEISAAGNFGDIIDEMYFENPTKMPGWVDLSKDKQDDILNFIKVVQERDKLLNEQEYLLNHENKLLGDLKSKYGLSGEDVTYEMNVHNDSDVSKEELDLVAKELDDVLSISAERKTA